MARAGRFHPGEHPGTVCELKQRVLAAVSRHAPADALIVASSTSGLMPTDLQARHGSSRALLRGASVQSAYTCCRWWSWSAAVRRHRPAHRRRRRLLHLHRHASHCTVRREVPGHLTDRLQEALWREILHMVNDGGGDHGRTRRLDHLWPGPALGGDGHQPDLPPGAAARAACATCSRSSDPRLKWPWTKLRGAGADRGADRSRWSRGTQAAGRRALDP